MKKSKGNQATLFQTSWGHSAQSSSSRNPNSNRNEPNTSQAHMGAFSVFDPNEMVELEDDEDDELLAAAEGIVPFDEAEFRAKYNGGGQAKVTNILCNPDDAEVIPGFDLEAGNVWIYPTNYPIRNYQYNIVEQALFKNTLVTLPTGLGKTFIAAVIMYNFYRWYPQGKVIFMAPTKPLVAQQIEACYNIMGIPQSDTAEMTGNMAPNKRQSMWQSRRVFFLTPQVLQNDLNRGSCKAEEVVLLVADEAHKALGNHAYCQVVREISGYTRNFRVLALSATPGDNPEAVQQVITNLLISHMELRSEESPDIKPYTHSRLVEKVVVSLGEDIAKVKNSFLKILETIVGRLFCQRVLWNNDPQRVSKFMLLTARDQYRKRVNEQGGFDRNRQGLIEGDFAMCISLYHAYELLLQHGILSFYNFIKAIIDGTKGMARAKAEITKNHEFTQLMDELREEIEPPMESGANESLLFSQFSPRRRALMNVPKPSSTFKSHPKLLKLKEIVLEHFEKFQDKSGEDKKGVATRVMIFSQYRDSVNEIAAMLSHHKPVVRVMSFIGQQSTGKSTRGLTQKEQLQVVQRFRQGGYNTLVATCVGEEGLDIGEVDLIVCFDAHASPIRLVQRMGRTGRKRDGRIVILVTEGKEEQVYMRSQRSKKSIHKAVTQAAKSFDLYTDNHRMVPRQITPAVLKMEMTVGKFVGQSKGKKEKRTSDGANIKKFTTKSLTTASKKSNGFLTYEEVVYWQENFKLPEHEAGLSPQLSVTKKSRRSLSEAKKPVTQISLSEWLPWQTTLHPVKAVTHSRRTEHLIELLEFTELQGGRGDDDESCDLEMMSFLNEEDILKPGQKEDDAEEILVFETDPDVGCQENEGTSKIAKKAKKTRKKLQLGDETDAENDGQSSRKKGNGENNTTAKKKSKGLKKRSPENKARWKAFLNQFDNQEDEDFERDSTNAAFVPDEDKAVDHCLQRADDETLDDDLPEIGDPWKPDDKPAGFDKNQTGQSNSNEPITTHNEITRVQECEGGDLSDAASDEMTNLFPAVTPHSQGSVPGFQLKNERFPLVMASVPTPPSLDALDEMSLSSVDAELHDFNMDFEEIQRKYFGEKQFEKDLMDKSEAVSPSLSPNVCSEGDLEPFLMADFLQDEERETDAEPSEEKMLKMSRDERMGPVTLTSDCPSETATKTYFDKPIRREVRYRDSENQSSKDKYDNSEYDLHGKQGSQVVAKDCNNGGGSKDHDTRGISNSIVADVSCGSPIKGEDATIGEGFLMDVTDDHAFANISLLGDDYVGVNETKSDKHKHTDKQDLLLESEWVGKKSKNVSESEVNGCDTKLGMSKHVGKSNLTAAGQCRASGDVDLTKSISKLSAFRRFSTNNQETHSEKEKIGVLKKREGTLSMEGRSTLPLHEVRTRGEHSNSNAIHSEVDVSMLHAIRNSGAAPPLATNLSNGDLSSKLGVKPDNLAGAFRDGLPCRDSESERLERKSHLTGLTSRGRVENETGDAVDNIGKNVGLNSTIKTRDKEGNIDDNTVNNIGDNTDNACRTPLPKKRKLSLKRTSPKDKGMPATKKQGKTLPVNEAKSLNFGASQSLNLNRREESFCSTNVREPETNPSSWAMKYKDSEASVRQSLAMRTAPRGPSLDCENPSVNSSNLRTEDGNVVAVMNSDDDDEDNIRPVGKASSRRRQALSSPCSQGFKMPANPGKQNDNNQRNGLSSRHLQPGSESDDEFETDKSAGSRSEFVKTVQVKARAQKRNPLDINAKQGTRKSLESVRKKNSKRFRNNHFLDDEAELSGSDINDFSSDETDGEDEGEMDSFIDDATQLTQRTPSATKPRPASSPVDMMAVYRQSLMSPLCGALNFRTPAFHKQRNKYKMVYKYRGVEEDSQSASEAEETYESESVLENEGEAEDENEAENDYESEAGRRSSESAQANAHARADVSFEESQIGRPVKRMKRKRILDDSFDNEVSPRLSKHRNFSETCDKENILENSAMAVAEGNKIPIGVAQQRKSGAFGNFLTRPTAVGHPFQGDFVKSSEAIANKKYLHDNTSTLRRSEVNKGSMRRSGAFIDEWNNDISDSELLVALEDKVEQASINRTSEKSSKPQSNDKFHDQDFKENPLAMDMTDNDVSMITSTLPNFSLGFDFLCEVTSTKSESEEGRNFAKDNTVTFLKQRNVNCTGSVNRHSGAEFPNFTRITQHSGQNSGISCQELRGQHTENKVNVKQMSRSTSESTKAEPRKVTNSNISSGRSVVSDQSQAFSKLLATQNKSSSHNSGQLSAAIAHAKLQVVTPSCRPNDVGTRPAISPLLTSSQRDKGKTVILVDTREISSSQVVSLLRLKHNIKAEVCQLTSCDYIVSNRMAVKRKTASDVANGANSQKLVECMRRMCDLYDRPCLIIEKDRVKPGETEKHFIKSKAYILTLASIAQTHVKIIFSESQEETARLLTDLADIETKKGIGITACTSLSKEREQVFRVVQSIPRVSYVTALNLCSSFKTLQEIVHSTAAELERRTPGLSNPRAAEIHKYLRHKFDSDMLAAKK